MKILNARNAKWQNQTNSIIECEVMFEEIGEYIPFVAAGNDVEAHGIELFGRISAGEFGQIQAFVPIQLTRLFSEVFAEKSTEIKTSLNTSIATILGTVLSNLQGYEAKMFRLTLLAGQMKSNPELFYGMLFNGVQLGNTNAAVIATATEFLGLMATKSAAIEASIQQHNALTLALSTALTVTEVDSIVV